MSYLPVNIPRNFLRLEGGDVFGGRVPEKRELEQYFWTSNVVRKILEATQWNFKECCCFTTPSLAHLYHESGNDQTLLDIDTRFKYLPRFERFDITAPHTPVGAGSFEVLVIDPPFCGITTDQLYSATEKITGCNYDTKIIIAYLVRFEHALLDKFKRYGISETSTPLEYAGIKENKWGNFALYSNVDLPGIKRIPGKYGYRGKNHNELIYSSRHTDKK
jgi:hypothetical protein